MVKSDQKGEELVMISLLNNLIAQKEAHENRRIFNREISEQTGVNENTIGRLRRNEPIGQITAAVATALCKYFDCNIGDLVTIQYVGETSGN